ncbi:hypothetical protein IAU60_000125 [Kwoniella sp. DSM 27419]
MAVSDEVNLLLLIELAAVVIAASAFLFYWNRLLGSVIAWIIRLYAWRSLNAYVVIGSLQLSPLAGRISFRDVEYHSSNISVRALHGNITWRYWKLKVRQEPDPEVDNLKRSKLPCRISVFAEGVEGFVYNRTPAYDAIVERMKKHERDEGRTDDTTTKQSSRTSEDTAEESNGTLRSRLKKAVKPLDGTTKPSQTPVPESEIPSQVKPVTKPAPEGVNWFREALPLDVRIVSGSLVLGSDATPMVLIGDFKRTEGILEITDSRSSLDLYKLAVNFTFHDANVLMRTNVDYSGSLLAHGKKVYDELLKRQPDLASRPPSALSVFDGFHLLARQFAFLYDPKFSTPPVAGLPTDKVWRGLARYRDPDSSKNKGSKREEREYAKVTSLLETHRLDLTYYADTPGPIPERSDSPYIDDLDEVGNVDLPPEYGIDIVIHKGNVRYGPWADQQRDALQRAFAPSLFFDSEPKPRLKPGDIRVHTTMILHILLEEETIMRIPTREPSKDWQFDNAPADVERRYGWLDVVVGPNSSISYTQDQVATRHGYDSMLVLQLDSLGISSSVNLDTFIRAKTCKRDWGMDVTLDTPSISLLRDHVTLISDLAKDWSSGAAVGDYHHFVPNHYNFRVSLINYAMHLYINDYNIIDAPWSRDTNAFMDVYGPRIDAFVAVASTQYRPESSTVPFSVSLSDARVELCVPKWDTHRAFGEETIEIGKIGLVTAKGSYLYYSAPRPDHQETLNLHLEGKNVVFKAMGWVLRRLFCVKDNYFGGFTQFRTMQEYLERFDHDPDSVADPVEEKYRPGRSDPFAVNVTMNVEESLILLPDEIYSFRSGVVMPVPQLQMNLKSVDHFMELSLDSPPTYIVAVEKLNETYARGRTPAFSGREALFIEGIELKANRLFGPQPYAATYLCLWEATVPKITGFLTPDFTNTLQAVGQAVGYTFTDPDNGPAEIYVPKTSPDVTFFKFNLDRATVMLTSEGDAISAELSDGMSLDTSTWGTRSYSSVIGVLLPSLRLDILERDSKHAWRSVGSTTVGAAIDIYNAPAGWRETVAAQQVFLRAQDEPTGRIWYMYRASDPHKAQHAETLYLPPPMQQVLDDDESDTSSEHPSIRSKISTASTSSASPSESDDQVALASTRTSKRSRSFTTAFESPGTSSVGDESDSTDSASSSEESVGNDRQSVYNDMAAGLSARLKTFRFVSSLPAHDSGLNETRDFADKDQQRHAKSPRAIDTGTIIHVTGQKADLAVTPEAVPALSRMMTKLSAKADSHERRLDALLVAQVQNVDKRKITVEPRVVNLYLPDLNLLVATARGKDVQAVCHVQGIDLSLYSFAPPDKPIVISLDSTIDLIDIAGITSTLEAQQLSLRDVNGLDVRTDSESPVIRLSVSGLSAHASQSQGIRAQVRLTDATLDAVTAAIPFASYLLGTWTQAIKRISTTTPAAISDAQMLYAILKTAVDHGYADYQPAFAYERAYGLHVQDSRNIRTQTGWWLLARFRDWHRRMPMNMPTEERSLEVMAEYVIRQLCRVDYTVNGAEEVVRSTHFIRNVFGLQVVPSLTGKPKEKAMDIFLYADSVRVRHHDRSPGTGSIASSSLGIKTASMGGTKAIGLVDDRPVTQIKLMVAVEVVESELHDSLIGLLSPVLQHASSSRKLSHVTGFTSEEVDSARIIVAHGQLGLVDIDVIGGGLRLHYGSRHMQIVQSSRRSTKISSEGSQKYAKESINATAGGMELVILEVPEDKSNPLQTEDRAIASLKTEGLRIRVDRLARKQSPVQVQLLLGVKSIEFDSKPQLRSFYAYVQGWKEKQLPHYAAAIKEVRAMLARSPKSPSDVETPPGSRLTPTLHLSTDIAVESVKLQVRAAKALWLRWDIGKLYVARTGDPNDVRFAVRLAPQVVGAYTSLRKTKSSDSSAIRLPSITVIGTHNTIRDRSVVEANIEMGFFTGVLKPVILDRLLSLHQRIAVDMTQFIQDWRGDLQKVMSKRHSKDPSTASDGSDIPVSPKGLSKLFDVHIGVAGIRFGLRADDVATTLLFEALAMEGRATNRRTENEALHWRAKVDHFGLSLGHLGRQALSDHTEPIRKHRTAYMVLDAEVHEIPATARTTSKLIVSLSRVHTVMHPQALSELADLLKSWTSDLHVLREHRATEVAEVKEHTSRVLKRLESAEKVEHSDVSWFANRLVSVELSGVGLAIPLVEGAAIGGGHGEVPALLYSIRLISFQNRRNETARFKVKNMALQFIAKFDQSCPEHFTGDFHQSVNCMTLPSIDSEAQMSSTMDTWQLSAHCSATDFKLSLAPDVVEGIFKLIDLFEHGKDRIVQLEEHYRAEMAKQPQETVASKYDDPATPISVRTAQRILVRMSFTFTSGIVELHRELSESDRRNQTADTKKHRAWHDTVVLPTLSVWVDYAGPEGSQIPSDSEEDSAILLFNAAVHESHNQLRPSILPFFVQLVNRIERRNMERQAPTSPVLAPEEASTKSVSLPEEQRITPLSRPATDKIRLRVTLRIDGSRLRLSCAPDSNAYADLKWDSGGFMASTTIGGHDTATVAGTVSGVTAYLRHEFAEEGQSCIEAGAKDMAFSIAYCPHKVTGQKGLSIVLDTQLAARFRLEQLSAWLTFAAVWIETAPPLDLPPTSAMAETAVASTHPSSTAQPSVEKLAIAALIRFRSIDFDANVGVTYAKLNFTPIILRTLSNGEKTELDFDIGVTHLTADGEISGDMRSEFIKFHTIRQSSRSGAQAIPTVLSMMIDAGDLTGNLFLQDLSVLRFHLEPAVVRLADDWKAFNEDQRSQVNLAFAVKTGVFRAIVRLLAIPTLLNKLYSISNMVESQERMASHRSNTFKATKLRKSTEPSPMTAVIMHTARKAGQNMTSSPVIRTAQTMRFDLGGMDIGIFNAPISEDYLGDFYRFTAGKFEADLRRRVTREGLPKRDLSLLISYVTWHTSDGPRAARDAARLDVVKEIIESASQHGPRQIAKLPLMSMTMSSVEEPRPPVLVYDFDLVWGEGDGDVAILPRFFEKAYRTFQAFSKGLDQEGVTQAKRRGGDATLRTKTPVPAESGAEDKEDERSKEKLRYRRKFEGQRPLPVPRLRLLGDGTGIAMEAIPRINQFSAQLPIMIHKGVTSPLEDGMDLLLRLYEKQLPDNGA